MSGIINGNFFKVYFLIVCCEYIEIQFAFAYHPSETEKLLVLVVFFRFLESFYVNNHVI